MPEQLQIALSRCISFIKAEQLSNGSFESASFTDVEHFTDRASRKTTFYNSLIISALASIKNDETLLISSRTARFLYNEKGPNGSYNYWQKDSGEKKLLPYPDDLDDTFTALTALYQHDASLLTEKLMLSSINILINCESNVGGPYYTWLVPKPRKGKWKDVDIVVNSNVAHFLSLNEIDCPPLTEYIEHAIRQQPLTSSYYHSPISIVYFISKWYRGKEQKKLKAVILKKRLASGHWDNPFETALSVVSLLNLGAEISMCREAILYLCHATMEQSWQPYAFYIEQIHGKKVSYSGSSAFTASVIAEALAMYMRVSEHTTKVLPRDAQHIEFLLQSIRTASKEKFNTCIKPLQIEAFHIIDAVLTRDKNNEITLTPYFFARSFLSPLLKEDLLIQLGVANTLGWIGYTIYDDILDREAKLKLLPLANIMVREVSDIFSMLVADTEHYKIITSILDGIDNANYWEKEYATCVISQNGIELPHTLPHYGTYGILAQKSLGHAIGPMIVCMLSGKWHALELTEQTRRFFEHYIIAKQLHDDAHDWLEDLSKGHINSVGVEVVKIWKKSSNKKIIVMEKERDKMQLIFWQKVIDPISKHIIEHAKNALGILETLPVNGQAEYFKNRILALEKSARLAISERNHALRFIQAYHQ
jgi:hypothetical protein